MMAHPLVARSKADRRVVVRDITAPATGAARPTVARIRVDRAARPMVARSAEVRVARSMVVRLRVVRIRVDRVARPTVARSVEVRVDRSTVARLRVAPIRVDRVARLMVDRVDLAVREGPVISVRSMAVLVAVSAPVASDRGMTFERSGNGMLPEWPERPMVPAGQTFV